LDETFSNRDKSFFMVRIRIIIQEMKKFQGDKNFDGDEKYIRKFKSSSLHDLRAEHNLFQLVKAGK
jgi:hypothetical protein